MNSRLPRLSPPLFLLAAAALTAAHPRAAAAQSTADVERNESGVRASASTSAGDKLLQQASTMLQRRASVSARLRHQLFLGGKPLYGVGSYWQQGSGPELRVRLELQIAGQDASLRQISNGRFMWIDRQLPTGRGVSRIDLWQLRADPVLQGANPDELAPGKAAWEFVRPELTAHSGGVPSLLASLAENFSFLPPQAMRLAAQSPADAQSASTPVFAVVGHWKSEKLTALLAASDDPSAESGAPASVDTELAMLNSLPNRLPQEVLLLVGQADLFPYRVEFRRLETPLATATDSPPIPYQLSANPLVVLELMDVAFDVPIAAGQFDYNPGDADWTDQTALLLERLRRERQQQIAVRPDLDKVSLPAR